MTPEARLRAVVRAARLYAQGMEQDRATATMRRHLDALDRSGVAPEPGTTPVGRACLGFPDRGLWLRTRMALRTIGGSSLGAILLGRWEGEWGVYAPGLVPVRPEAELGLRWEDHILSLYFDRDGAPEREPCPEWSIHLGPEPFGHGSVDALAIDPDDGPGGVDAKLIRHHHAGGDPHDDPKAWGPSVEVMSYDDPGRLHYPPEYDLQMRWLMWATGRDWWDIAALFPHYELRVYRIHRDLEAEAILVDRAYQWWERHIAEGEPPEPSSSDTYRAWLMARREQQALVSREATLAEMDTVYRLVDAREAHRAAKAAEQEARAQALALLGDNTDALTFAGSRVLYLTGRQLRARRA